MADAAAASPLTPAEIDRLLSMARHGQSLASANWQGDKELDAIVAKLSYMKSLCAPARDPAPDVAAGS